MKDTAVPRTVAAGVAVTTGGLLSTTSSTTGGVIGYCVCVWALLALAPANESRSTPAATIFRIEGVLISELSHSVTLVRMDISPHFRHGARDQLRKFSKYRLGVGPRWPWYFEPRADEPYGLSAGVVIRRKLTWPIFIPG